MVLVVTGIRAVLVANFIFVPQFGVIFLTDTADLVATVSDRKVLSVTACDRNPGLRRLPIAAVQYPDCPGLTAVIPSGSNRASRGHRVVFNSVD